MTAPAVRRCDRHRTYWLASCPACRAAQSAAIPQPRPTPEDRNR